ncbi:sulfotransferase domain-containing protein [Salinibacter ruber]|uniref:sulfotransferase domain-containing protein n=1 Tax=Salinibacter ruber TaxID=146919 RepID=UPI000E5838A8|nr:sulfotransferase domain-containing protein [Salinibacter ruber]
MKKPTFVGIGAPRCGTTWIYKCLKEHGDIYIPKGKSVQYFNNRYNKTSKWYFKRFETSKKYKAIGEYTPGYLTCTRCPKRLYSIMPNIKLLLSIRDPIDRAYSAYKHHVRKGVHNLSFADALSKNKYRPKYINPGLYYDHIKRYLKYYDKDQISILIYEELKKSPSMFAKRIFKSLGVDHSYKPKVVGRKVNRGIGSKTSVLKKNIVRVMDCFNKIKWFRRYKEELLSITWVNNLLDSLIFHENDNNIPENIMCDLRERFFPQASGLSSIIDKDMVNIWWDR